MISWVLFDAWRMIMASQNQMHLLCVMSTSITLFHKKINKWIKNNYGSNVYTTVLICNIRSEILPRSDTCVIIFPICVTCWLFLDTYLWQIRGTDPQEAPQNPTIILRLHDIESFYEEYPLPPQTAKKILEWMILPFS